MQELSDKQLYQAIHFAKTQDEAAGRAILESFQSDQPALAQTIFGVFPSMIAEQDQNMAHLFMDLCFDVICVFQHAFGSLPSQKDNGFAWLEKSAALLDPELQAMISSNEMDGKLRNKLQDRFVERMIDSNVQKGLVKFMEDSIDEDVKEHAVPVSAVKTAKTMIFVVVQLFCSLYDHAAAKG